MQGGVRRMDRFLIGSAYRIILIVNENYKLYHRVGPLGDDPSAPNL